MKKRQWFLLMGGVFVLLCLGAYLSVKKFSHVLVEKQQKETLFQGEQQVQLARLLFEREVSLIEKNLLDLFSKTKQYKSVVQKSSLEDALLKSSDFLGLIQFEKSADDWFPVQTYFKNSLQKERAYFLSHIQEVLPFAIKQKSLFFTRILDRQGQPKIVVIKKIRTEDERSVFIAGVLPIQYFSSMNTVSKGRENKLYVLNHQG
ncbi:MAG: hypothetical protein D6797_07590, partial [Bdellovibrio sp.]